VGARAAWDLAERAARRAGVRIRPLTTVEDADRILDVMIETWGEHQLLPREMIVALADCGNVPYGAFDGDTMVGYVLGWAAVDPVDGVHVHSHMLAARPDRRHGGVGYALKLAQRAACLDQDVHLVRWTFDPLLARNASLNVRKLGAWCDRFRRNFYGAMSDALNEGDRSDRLVVRWDLDRAPGPWTLPSGAERTLVRSAGASDRPHPVVDDDPGQPDGIARIEVPADYPALRRADEGLAAAWRDAVADAFERSFDAGMGVVAFDASPATPAYRLAAPGAAGAIRQPA
jgi:predicted GNAT superfamily acetyltransferase